MAEKNEFVLRKTDAVALMSALDFSGAEKWSRKKMRKQLTGLHDIVEDDFELDDGDLNNLLNSVISAGENGEAIDVVPDEEYEKMDVKDEPKGDSEMESEEEVVEDSSEDETADTEVAEDNGDEAEEKAEEVVEEEKPKLEAKKKPKKNGKGKKKSGRGKKSKEKKPKEKKAKRMSREDSVIKALKTTTKKAKSVKQLADMANDDYIKNGGNDNLKHSSLIVRRAIQFCEPFGVLSVEDGNVQVVGG